MMKLKYNWILLIILFLNPLILMSMNSMISMWINMELNLILFLTFIIMNNFMIYDMSMKYFLMSSFSSSIFFFLIIMNYFMNIDLLIYFMNFLLLLKLGFPPFHFWYIDLMMNLNWISCLMLSTWQKFIPMIFMFFLMKKMFLYLIILLGGLISIFKAFNTIYLKMILSYSSINHLGWMLMSLILSFNMWLIYYLSYSILMLSILFIFNKMKLIYLNDFNKLNLFFKKKLNLMLMMSLGGLPPFFGFLMKWFFIYKMVFNLNYFYLMMMIFFSLMFLYYYLRMVFNYLFLFYYNLKFNFFFLIFKKEKLMLMFYLISILNLFSLMIFLN
uniref:NADH dehydrogenase subunit 2 n=1 Tax=Microplitis manilae TaxID=1427173 RepID=UPI002551F227|nr:NADH dehydrogenase subunit 2 [Microplitis manilae]WGS91498.1 NADH dehydrogenase subunit 2 [Microplitis manilae]WUY11099.1 NADH dehydrogenase subunit 2 [Microplitis manilae]